MAYKYITENNLYNKQTYMYSQYGGIVFLKEYIESRQKYLNKCEKLENTVTECSGEKTTLNDVVQDLLNIRQDLKSNKQNSTVIDLINEYTKSFEVRKRIYKEYDNNWKPIGNMEFDDYEVYLIFADCLILSYGYTKCLKYFSCLIKVNDTLLSVQDKLDVRLKQIFYQIIKEELYFFYELAEKIGINLEE